MNVLPDTWSRSIRVFLVALAVTLLTPGLAQADEDSVSASVVPARTTVSPGDTLAIAVILDHEDGWHSQSNNPNFPPEWSFKPEPTTLTATSPDKSADLGPVQWPLTETVMLDLEYSGNPRPIEVLGHRAVMYIPVVIRGKPGTKATVEVALRYQACNDQTCLRPVNFKQSVTFDIVEPETATAPVPLDPATFGGFDASIFAKLLAGEVSAPTASWKFDFLGANFEVANNSYAVILVIAFAAGFLLNLTPCVLPVVPLKVLSLQQQASNPAKLILFGTIYCVGILTTFVALGLIIFGLVTGGQKQEWGQIFSSGWFSGGMAIIVAAMGLGMLGLFHFRLPNSVYMLSPTHDTAFGNFLLGVLTAILSAPCTGPLLGATIAWSVTQPAWLGLATFVVMGAGMAFPYAVLIAFPKLVDRLPKAGPGGELLKQVMGVLMLSVAAFLASNLFADKWTWWVVGGLGAAAFLWAIIRAPRTLRTRSGKSWTIALSSIAIVGTLFATASLADEGPIDWTTFRNKPNAAVEKAVAEANAAGKIVVIDFTAKWCTNCHVIEKRVLNSPEGLSVLNHPRVVPIKVDLTNSEAETGWDLVRSISGGGAGIPLIAVFRPGESKPTYFNSFFPVSALVSAVGLESSEVPAPK